MSHKYLLALSLFGIACSHPTPPAVSSRSSITGIKSTSESPKQSESILKSGKYIGMDYMGVSDITPDDSTDKWYHEYTLTIKADSLHLIGVPVVIYKGQPKAYSSSDGGFYSYRGKAYHRGNQLIAKMLLTSHDYISYPVTVPPNKLAQAELDISYEEKVRRGIYLVDSTFYKREFAIISQAGGFLMDSVLYRHNK